LVVYVGVAPVSVLRVARSEAEMSVELAPVADIEVIEMLDFDPEIACQMVHTAGDTSMASGSSPQRECGKPAAWIIRCVLCGAACYCCDECKQWIEGEPLVKRYCAVRQTRVESGLMFAFDRLEKR
jgi:hypothetical protein